MAAMQAVWAQVAAGATLVTANQRLARALQAAFDQHQRALGLRTWSTASIHPWDGWLGLLWQQRLERSARGSQRPLVTPAQASYLWSAVADDDQPAPALIEMANEARALCGDWGIDADELDRHASTRDSQLFAAWQRRFEARLERDGLTDGTSALRQLIEDDSTAQLPAARKVIRAGPDDWQPMRRQLFDRLARLGCEISALPPPRAVANERVRVRCHDRAVELESAARFARAVVEADASARVAVVVPDLESRLAEARRAFLAVTAPGWQLAPGHELPVNFSASDRVASMSLAQSGLLVLRFLGEPPDYRDAARLLRSRHVGEYAAEAAGRGEMEFALRERIGLTVDLQALAGIAESCAPLFAARLKTLEGIRRELRGRQRLGVWLQLFRRALEAAGWPGVVPLESDEQQALKAWWRLGDELQGCDSLGGPVERGTALQLLERAAFARRFQPAGSGQRIHVVGSLEALGQSFDAIWVTGMTATDWPPVARPMPLIPLELQRKAGMPECDPAVELELARRRLDTILASAPVAVASSPAYDGDEPISESPLIASLPTADTTALPRWTGTAPWQVVPATLASSPDPAPVLKLPARVRGGASVLERQSACPARAFLQDRLRAHELPRPSPGIDGARRGQITHQALADIYLRLRDSNRLQRLSPAEESALLGAVIDEALQKVVPGGGRALQRMRELEHQRQLGMIRRFLATERARAGFSVQVIEGPPGAERLPQPVRALGFGLRIDRLDELADGTRILIDYKTGAAAPKLSHLWETRVPAPQLPLYAIASDADAVAWIHLSARDISWLGAGRNDGPIDGVVGAGQLRRSPYADWDALRAHWWHTLERLAAEFGAGDFRINHWNREPAEKQWALATRVFEVVGDSDADEDEET